MTWELRGFAENGTILFRIDGKLVNESGAQLGLGFEGKVFADGVLSRVSVCEQETIYFAGLLEDRQAVLCYLHPNGSNGFNFTPPQDAAGSIVKTGDLIIVTLDILVLDGKAKKIDMAWVNSLAHGTLIGDIRGDLERMAKAFVLMTPYWKAILPSVKTDSVTGDHLDGMLLSKQTTWELSLPYYGCLAWLFTHLWETKVFNTAQHQFILDDDFTLTIRFTPVLLHQHQPSRN